ncbi:MAG: pyruvate, phosphate dikinase [Bacteroidota bacterium]
METLENVKSVYKFGDGKAEGDGSMKNLLGGKGANLEEMSLMGIPVPPGFTITTEVCTHYQNDGKDAVVKNINDEVLEGIANVEEIMGTKFGSAERPCLVSVRSGARVSMPGMMDTVLNIGLNDEAVLGLAKMSGKDKFAWDSYRRFIQMYGDVVMNIKDFTEDGHDPFEHAIERIKEAKGVETDQELTADHLKELVEEYKSSILRYTGKNFPTDPHEQLWNSVMAVFESWTTERAVVYRELNNIPGEWGTAVNVQAMVYGNMGTKSGSGVAFTRDSGTGEDLFNGEYMIDAQGEDVVAGIRTPLQITTKASKDWATFADVSEEERTTKYPSLEEHMPEVYAELDAIQQKLEDHFDEMQDLEFTIQEGRLWMLQTRSGKRTAAAMIKIGMDMFHEGRIEKKELINRMDPGKLDELLHPIFETEALSQATGIAKGLPASPGAATGQVVFFADDAVEWKENNKNVIMVRIETSADDLKGMAKANGILTARGGMTSHAAVVARGMGKCCVAGCGDISIDYKARTMTADGKVYKEGDWISINGSTGGVYDGKIKTMDPELSSDFEELMKVTDEVASMKVRTNADTPETAQLARDFGAQGIGLCRTEHMFFEGGRIKTMREMILANDEEGRRVALDKLLPMQRSDFEGIFEAMEGYGVTIRLLDPPLHEFVPGDAESQQEMAEELGVPVEEVKAKVDELHELNPMLGHRGCRLGNTYPEITEMQARAIIEAALNLKAKGVDAHPEIMVPLTGTVNEMVMQEKIIRDTVEKVFEERGEKMRYLVGTMIEIPRAALIADKIAKHADFFSFGTNDLTQMTFGYSRDDAGKFLPIYIEKGILPGDPFESLDQEGVGQLVELATVRGRNFNKTLKVGVCGEHGGDPASIEFFNKQGLNYVSCSPFRVPIARLAAAQAAINIGN